MRNTALPVVLGGTLLLTLDLFWTEDLVASYLFVFC